jgi:hypothetical protein
LEVDPWCPCQKSSMCMDLCILCSVPLV